MKSIKTIFILTGKAFVLLKRNDALLISGATAFFTVFSLPPIIILSGNILSGIIFRTTAVTLRIYDQLNDIFGESTATTIHQIVSNFQDLASNPWITVGGVLFLIFVSTTLFNVIQQAIHRIWRVRLSSGGSLVTRLRGRMISLIIILLTGFLVLLTVVAETAVSVLKDYLSSIFTNFNPYLILPISLVLSLFIYTLWFAGVFRYLPAARMPFKIAIMGGLFTSVLFSIGKFILGKVLITEQFGVIFGSSASILLLMLFIFYSSMILYLGAAFTFVLMKHKGHTLPVRRHGERYHISLQE